MREKWGLPIADCRLPIAGEFGHRKVRSVVSVANLPDFLHVAFFRGLVQRDAKRLAVDDSEIHPVRFGDSHDVRRSLVAEGDANRVEARAAAHVETEALQTCSEG